MAAAATGIAGPSPSTGGIAMPSPNRSTQQQPAAIDSPEKAVRHARVKRPSPTKSGVQVVGDGSGATGVGKRPSKSRFAGSVSTKPLVPATERRSREETSPGRKLREKTTDEKVDITPDGGSAGRDGRQFTVANVGNNGRIYLRPSIRPPHQRQPQPHFVFPITPPTTAGLDSLAEKPPAQPPQPPRPSENISDLNSSLWTPSPATPTASRQQYFTEQKRRPAAHRRALSDSTTREDPDTGGFKVVISKPGDDNRPKTMEDIGPANTSFLDIDIPNYRIGNPRFTLRGTPFFRGSSYAPSEEYPRSSNVSCLRSHRGELTPRIAEFSQGRLSPVFVPQIRFSAADTAKSPLNAAGRLPLRYRSTYLSAHVVIEPSMFDALTLRPDCDDRSIVRYSQGSGAVTAATPPRLVAEITSPSFLDYELISDFFLTYRSFLEPSDLLKMLMARLRWALARNDEIGMVVRVRTFVATRHWVLNYFMDDFLVDYGLRASFCDLLNDLFEELSRDPGSRKVQMKILGELKKCWRRVCGQFWDVPEADTSAVVEMPIVPGGAEVHHGAVLNSSCQNARNTPPRLSELFAPLDEALNDESFYADVSKAGHLTQSQIVESRPSTPEQRPTEQFRRQETSPTSISSLDVVSCSLPGKLSRMAQKGTHHPLAAHPVPPSTTNFNSGPVATTPRALTGKRVRPNQAHKRNGSLTDSLRKKEHSTEDLRINKDWDAAASHPFAGDLVRGNLLPPGQPFVEMASPSLWSSGRRQTTLFQQAPEDSEKRMASAMSGQGMKRLIGSVRRHLGTRGQGVSPTQGSFINISPIGPRGATTNRLPGTAIVPQARSQQNGLRPPVRIDLLGAEIAEDFKKAVRDDAATEAHRRDFNDQPPHSAPLQSALPNDLLDYSAAHTDSTGPIRRSAPTVPGVLDHLRPMSDTAITAGSKSIVIVDDTVPSGLPSPLPDVPATFSSAPNSVEAFGENLLPTNPDPTPPTTPPGRPLDRPRRSSHLLNQHALRPSLSSDQLPPFVPDLGTLRGEEPNARPSNDFGRPSTDIYRPSTELTRHSSRKPPLTGSVRMHRRQKSSRTNRSLNSMLHRRVASYQSAWAPHSTVRSFDATTYSGGNSSADEQEDTDPVPQPLRILRRRPGGDLRAATNIGDLDALPLRKSRSVGSLTTYSESLRSSYLRSPEKADTSAPVQVVSGDFSPGNAETFSLGAIAEQTPKRNLSLFSTHSSKPVMRPSFEAEAQKLAQIPDDEDDGGIESALAKLEGKFDKRAFKLSMEPSNAPLPDPENIGIALTYVDGNEGQKKEHRQLHVGNGEEDVMHHEHPRDPDEASTQRDHSTLHVPEQRPQAERGSFLSDGSGASYSSTPLLERGFTDDGRSKRATNEWGERSILVDPDEPSPVPTPRPSSRAIDSQHLSYEFVEKTNSMERMKSGDTLPPPSASQSFLDDESVNGTDLSSDLSIDASDANDFGREGVVGPHASVRRVLTPTLGESLKSRESQPPSPPMTLVQALRMSPESPHEPKLHEHQIWPQKPLPPTPDTTPTAPLHPGNEKSESNDAFDNSLGAAKQDLSKKFSVHLPFILAFDSDLLSQQLTLIEKDALNEIDWKELIEMGWKNATNNDSRSWVDFLRNTDAHGVEVVIARFNIMVKWACSEIVLTQDIEERARCIIKYIHIAANCRRYRNFATLGQITIALTSQEVARLSRTWSLVPEHDLKTLQELESLVSPMRNFHNLRAEMEAGSDSGCIPFVGIYTHDLLFNAQRPSEIASSPTTAPLVNFERCRHAATIVKTLLRLLEASTVYDFQPVEGVTERCLWMSALTDEEIRKHSESLE